MTVLRRVPAGRTGRLWLLARLRTGRRAADLLDRKLRILRSEQERFHLLAEHTREHWQEAQRRADTVGLRAAMMGGARGVRLLTPAEPAEVAVSWASVMGLRYPAGTTCRFATPSDMDRSAGTTALVGAPSTYQAAVAAAAAHAAAATACRTIDAEVKATRQRLRAITDRWLPDLEEALRQLSTRLDEAERAETVRLRWTSRIQATGGAR
jgi:V/A-type H+/Na+-transporting ATPase subunit D